ncbi:MAG: ABC transporter ATP-binding protein [Gammaproteobacteria bacterium]
MKTNLRELLSAVWQVGLLIRAHAEPWVKARLLLVFVLVATGAVVMSLSPLLLKELVDALTQEKSSGFDSALLFLALYAVSQLLLRALAEWKQVVYAQAERRISRTLSREIFAHILGLPFRFHLQRQTGAILQSVNQGISGSVIVLQSVISCLVPVAFQVVTVVIVLISLHQTAIIPLLVSAVACYALVFEKGASQTGERSRDASHASIDSNAVLTDAILNCETVKCFTAEAAITNRYDMSLARVETAYVRLFRASAANSVWVASIFAFFIGTTLLYALVQVRAGNLTVGGFVLISAYAAQVVAPVELIGFTFRGLAQAGGLLKEMLDLFAMTRESSEGGVGVDSAENQGSLEFRSVTTSYSEGQTILDGVTFSISAGTTTAVVGASGAGKSTLARLLLRLIDPEDGEILLDGVSTRRMSIEQVRKLISIVPQDTMLFNDTIAYNIAIGREGCSQRDIENAARVASIHDFIVALPDGYHTRVGERGVRLSGGEKQRIAIARAAIRKPSIYVFDEATSSLDGPTEREIVANLVALSRTATTMIIAHRLSSIVHADQVLVLDRGRIVERGSHAALLGLSGYYFRLWNAQQRENIVCSQGQGERVETA